MKLRRYWLTDGQAVTGPFGLGQLRDMFDAGEVGEGHDVCVEGTEDWMRLTDVLNIQPPPMPAQRRYVEVPPKSKSRGTSLWTLVVLALAGLFFLGINDFFLSPQQSAAITREVKAQRWVKDHYLDAQLIGLGQTYEIQGSAYTIGQAKGHNAFNASIAVPVVFDFTEAGELNAGYSLQDFYNHLRFTLKLEESAAKVKIAEMFGVETSERLRKY